MKIPTILASGEQPRGHWHAGLIPSVAPLWTLTLLASAAVVGSPIAVNAQDVPLPVPAAGVPGYPTAYANAGGLPAAGDQYVVYVPDTDPMLLEQLRQVEPGAFVTNQQGQSVIQVGRYSYYQNAQQQVSSLAGLGIGASIASVPVAAPTYSQLPAPPTPSSTYISSGELPPLPVVGVPQNAAVPAPTAGVQNVPFGQAPAAYPVAAVPTVAAPTVAPPLQAYPSTSGDMPLPPSTAPVVSNVAAPPPNGGGSAPFYVVIPAASGDLPTISSRLIQLGTPADRVLQRTGGRGPNVAVGPFRDRGLAEQWNGYFREAGYGSSRVVYEP